MGSGRAGRREGPVPGLVGRKGINVRAIKEELKVFPLMAPPRPFRINVDGLRWEATEPVTFKLSGNLKLASARAERSGT